MRRPFVVGNWKMNTNTQSSTRLVQAIVAKTSEIAGQEVDVAVCPPFVYLQSVAKSLSSSNIALGAQDLYCEKEGAFTGEISADMLKDIGCTYALCGHSERRHVIGETDELINKKIRAAISAGILPILCIGELLQERQANKTSQIINNQTRKGLANLSAQMASAVTIAYEPVWAIGTGLTATPQQAQQAHSLIRDLLHNMYGTKTADEIRILYGGSVKANNAASLCTQDDVDGLLVGGASLKADDFVEIIKAAA